MTALVAITTSFFSLFYHKNTDKFSEFCYNLCNFIDFGENMKVVKFGGSSLASATQLEKVLNIIKSDEERRFVVVSAPGKRDAQDTKVTDALIRYYRSYTSDKDVTADQSWIINRYRAIIDELGLGQNILEKITKAIVDLANLPIEDNDFLYDTFLAAGEDNNAKLIAEYFRKNGLSARYIHLKSRYHCYK